MCPACVATGLASTAMLVAGVTSAGGLTALVVQKLRGRNDAKDEPRGEEEYGANDSHVR
jgi:hypothetical protein